MCVCVCQQMGDVGDNDQRVDEKLWDDQESEEGGDGADEHTQQRKEEYDASGSIQVEDKKDLDYEVRTCTHIHTQKHRHTHRHTHNTQHRHTKAHTHTHRRGVMHA